MMGVVMAGGRASRFGRKVEKGLLMVGGTSLLERAASALSVPGVDSVAAAVTHATPETARQAESAGLEVVMTSGVDYHSDTMELLDAFGRYACVNVDVPFVRRSHVSALMNAYGTGSAAAVVPCDTSFAAPEPGSVLVGPDGRMMVWVGLNIVSKDADTGLFVFEDGLLTVNINDDKDLVLANDLARQHGL